MSLPPTSQSYPPPSSEPSRQHQRSSSDESSASAAGSRSPPSESRGPSTTFPFSFIRTSQSKQTSTSIIPSTAEGKAIPVDDSTVENRTTALRELNSHYPSRHRYEKSTGAQSSTYSEPVIVRSYYSPVAPRPAASSGGTGGSIGGVIVHSPSGAKSQAGSAVSRESRGLPFVTTVASARNGMMNRIPRLQQSSKLPSSQADDAQAKLPPLEAFTFKSFIANMEAQSSPTSDINADLDRIAEICARSRYSLSNQYEVHYAPHGSGSSFLGGSNQANEPQGPTLQAVSSDDERSLKRQRRRRNGPRRSSRAMGTLETIMSSSRSSDEERSKKKSAAELADEVRGRATRKSADDSSTTSSSPIAADDQRPSNDTPKPTTPSRSKASLALIDGQALGSGPSNSNTTPHSSVTGLVSELALPQASTSQLELRTAPEPPLKQTTVYTTPKRAATSENLAVTVAKGSISPTGHKSQSSGLLSAIGGWLPWLSSGDGARRSSGRAEGSLRQLLRTTSPSDAKGKGLAIEA